MVIFWDTAIVLRVIVGDVGATTDTGELVVSTNVPAHVMQLIIRVSIGTLHVVVADNLTLCIGGVGWTVLGTLVVTCL